MPRITIALPVKSSKHSVLPSILVNLSDDTTITTTKPWTVQSLFDAVAQHEDVVSMPENDDLKMQLLKQEYNLVYDQVLLENRLATLESLGLPLLATMHVIPFSEENEIENGSPDSLSQEDLPRTIVITNIAIAEENVTQEKLRRCFESCGEIDRLVVQSNDSETQNAVIVFKELTSVPLALAFHQTQALDGSVLSVLAALELVPDETRDDAKESSLYDVAVAKMSFLLARAYLVGRHGVAALKKMDEEHHLSLKMRVGAELAKNKAKELDAHYQLSHKMATGAEAAKGHAQALDAQYGITNKVSAGLQKAKEKAGDFDEQYKWKSKAQSAANTAKSRAQALSSKAMESENVSSGVKKLNGMFNSLVAVKNRTVLETKEKLQMTLSPKSSGSDFGEKSTKEMASTATPAVPPPVPFTQRVDPA